MVAISSGVSSNFSLTACAQMSVGRFTLPSRACVQESATDLNLRGVRSDSGAGGLQRMEF
jgi:hypothetical protein